jgi:ABC-type transporter Mla subunit MlaD
MKKKESLWQLLQRLDEEAGQFNSYLSEANRYFDTTARETNALLMQQKKKLHTTILKVKRALKIFSKRKNTKTKNGKK